MRTDTSHRADLVTYSLAEYAGLADRCIEELSKIDRISSLVICGSLAKMDIVPGWSDIDLIIFLDSKSPRTDVHILQRIKHSISLAKGVTQIGIGIDIVYEDEFLSNHKLCGRPYGMTYEVAKYGQIRCGKDLFRRIDYDAQARSRVDNERPHLIAAEIHNWRRMYILQEHSGIAETQWLFACAKALLRILQCETGPNLDIPISCAGSLQRFCDSRPHHPAKDSFASAVQTRKEWDKLAHPFIDHSALLKMYTEALNSYPIGLPKI